jgi:hypothetical protein
LRPCAFARKNLTLSRLVAREKKQYQKKLCALAPLREKKSHAKSPSRQEKNNIKKTFAPLRLCEKKKRLLKSDL